MKKNLFITVFATFLLFACSSPKIDGTNEDAFKSSIQKISDSLSDANKQKFQTAYLVVAADFLRGEIGKVFVAAFAGQDMSDAPHPAQAFYSKMHGKDYKQIIEEADAIMRPKMQQDKEELTSLVTDLEAAKEQSLQGKGMLSKIKISNANLYSALSKSAREFGWTDDIFREHFIEFDIYNGTPEAISSLRLTGTITVQGRSIPYFEGKLNVGFPGGLEPEEKQHFKTEFNRWHDWAKAPKPKGSVLSLQAIEAYGAKDRPLWKNSFTDKEEEKLSKAKEKLQQIEQAGNDWYAVYGTEIQEDLAAYPSWIRAN